MHTCSIQSKAAEKNSTKQLEEKPVTQLSMHRCISDRLCTDSYVNGYYLDSVWPDTPMLWLRSIRCLRLLCRMFPTARGASPLYISRLPGSFMLPLTHWMPEATLEKKIEVFGAIEWRSSDCKWSKVKNSSILWVASVLVLRAILVRVKWSLENLLLLVFDGT